MIENKYGNNSRLLLIDPDSLMYEIKTEAVYEDFRKDKAISNYSAESKYDDNSNRLLVFKMKDETGGVAIKYFVWLKPKIHYCLVDDSSEHKKVKGVSRNDIEIIT